MGVLENRNLSLPAFNKTMSTFSQKNSFNVQSSLDATKSTLHQESMKNKRIGMNKGATHSVSGITTISKEKSKEEEDYREKELANSKNSSNFVEREMFAMMQEGRGQLVEEKMAVKNLERWADIQRKKKSNNGKLNLLLST